MDLLCLDCLGLCGPLVPTQVLPYLRQLMRDDIQVTLLTFEPEFRRSWASKTAAEWRERLEGEGIRWLSRPYHGPPSLPATAYNLLVGAWVAWHLVRRDLIDVLHDRAFGLVRFELEGIGGACYRRLDRRLFRANLQESRPAVTAS